MRFLKNIIIFLIFSFVFYSGLKSFVPAEEVTQGLSGHITYTFGNYDLMITVIKISECKYKLFFHRNPYVNKKDYITVNHCHNEAPPKFSIIYGPRKPYQIYLLQNGDSILEISTNQYTITKLDNIEKFTDSVGLKGSIEIFEKRILNKYGRNGIQIKAFYDMNGFLYYQQDIQFPDTATIYPEYMKKQPFFR